MPKPHVQIMLEALVVHATQDIQEMVSFAMVTFLFSFPFFFFFVKLTCFFFQDVNECQGEGSGNNCEPEIATCTNTQGSYTCKCNDGYDGTGFACEGIFLFFSLFYFFFRLNDEL
mgnify:CR=1 FL=1